MLLRCFPSSFGSIQQGLGGDEKFQDGRHGDHLGYLNGKILAILNLHTAPMPLTMFGLNLTWGADVVSRWPSCGFKAAILDNRFDFVGV